jgi:hypothetical protein
MEHRDDVNRCDKRSAKRPRSLYVTHRSRDADSTRTSASESFATCAKSMTERAPAVDEREPSRKG